MNILRFKTFEDRKVNPYLTTQETLTKYYGCSNCNALYRTFNEEQDRCKYCGSDIEQITDFEYMARVKEKLESDEYELEMKEKQKRENKLMDIINIGVNKEISNRRRNIN